MEMGRFEVLPGLPTYGPLARWVPESWKASGREGMVVRFSRHGARPWIANFKPGLTTFSTVVSHPNGRDLLVIAAGETYLVDAALELAEPLDAPPVSGCWQIEGSPDLIFDSQGLAFFRVGAEGIVWHTRRISWDGFRDVAVGSSGLTGQAWSAPTQDFHAFVVDIRTGRARGGAPQVPHGAWEMLAGG